MGDLDRVYNILWNVGAIGGQVDLCRVAVYITKSRADSVAAPAARATGAWYFSASVKAR